MADLQNDVLLREIDEDLRHERYMALWRRFGPAVVAAVVLLVAAIIGYQLWTAHQVEQRAKAAEAFAAAAREASGTGAAADAARAFAAIASDAPGGYALMARLREAAALAAAGERDRAIAAFHAAAADKSVADTYRNLALVLAALHEMTGGLQPQTLIALRTLADGTSPWRFSAREILAADLAAAKQTDEARALYSGLASDPATPAGIRSRARDMLAVLGG